jgi:uncharacterized protein (TIGR03435 family)
MRSLPRLLSVSFLLVAPCMHSAGQQGVLKFDVVAIHVAKPGSDRGSIRPLPGGNGYLVQNINLKTMIAVIYRIPARQITGGPDWINTTTFNIEARSDSVADIDDLHTMFKNLLTDRFGLKLHVDQKEGRVFELHAEKSGVKMKADGARPDLNIPINMMRPSVFAGIKVPMEYLCWFLSQQLRDDPRPVVDKTGLTQVYDFTLTFQPELPPGLTPDDLLPEIRKLPTLFDALPDQLGLRLQPAKGPVDFYVIDHAEMPSAN